MKTVIKMMEMALVLFVLVGCTASKKYDISGKFTIDVPKEYTLIIDDNTYEFFDNNNEKALTAEYVDGYTGYMFLALVISDSDSNFEDFLSNNELLIATVFGTMKVIAKKGESTIDIANQKGEAYLITNVNMDSNEFDKVLESFRLK